MKEMPEYAAPVRQMKAATDEEFVADLTRFVDSFADHDDDCPGYSMYERVAELAACRCGFARRHDLFDELEQRLVAR
ncbi:MAG: hypothetical protein WED86_06040 [Chloroflexota bacterium]